MTARVVRAVVDTNLLVRGILRRRPTAVAVQIYDAFLADRLQIVTSPYILAEVRKTLLLPEIQSMAPLPAAQVDGIVDALRDSAEVVAGRYDVDLVPTDAKDNPIIGVALEAEVPYLVTDDRRDLLPLKAIRLSGHRVVQIVNPTDFVRHILRPRKG